MPGTGADQKHLVVYLAGPLGVGKSKMAEKAADSDNSPFQIVPWRTTRFVRLEKRHLFKTSDAEAMNFWLVADRETLYDCKTRAHRYALLRKDVIEATRHKLGLAFGPLDGAASIRSAGFRVYIIFVHALGKRQVGEDEDTVPTFRNDDNPSESGVLVNEYYANKFGADGLKEAVDYLYKKAQELTSSSRAKL